MIVKQALSWARQCLMIGSQTPAIDARLLLMHVMALSQAQLIAYDDHQLTPEQQQQFCELIQKRAQGVPVAYLLGKQAFWSLQLKVTPDVLIPRPETECLVEWLLGQWSDQPNITVLDLGTGSGAIALALAYERPSWTIIGSDVSAQAVQIAQYNAWMNHLEQVAWVVSDWLAAFKTRRLFDVIISNPPYVAYHDPGDETSGYEPQTALLAGDSGLAQIRLLSLTAKAYLKPGGCLLIEHGSTQGEAVRGIMQNDQWQQVATLKDLANLERASWGYNR